MADTSVMQLIRNVVDAGRYLSIRKVGTKYIAAAVPQGFLGGPIPDDWRSESDELSTALGVLLGTWNQTPSDFNWPEMIEANREPA